MKLKMFVLLSIALAAVAAVVTACSNNPDGKNPPADRQGVLYYTCPMHPSVKVDQPGNCPICNMTLQPVYGSNAVTASPSDGGTNAPPSQK